MTEQLDWEKIRRNRFSPANTPPDWPRDVQPISMDGLTLFGVGEGNNIHGMVAASRRLFALDGLET